MMKNSVFEYKGYHTVIEFDAECLTLRGKIEGIGDLIVFESKSLDKIEYEFQNAVDDYLEFCKDVGKEPDKEYKGVFNVRIAPELHRAMALLASKHGNTLNAEVEKAIQTHMIESNILEGRLQDSIRIEKGKMTMERWSNITSQSQVPQNTQIINLEDKKRKML